MGKILITGVAGNLGSQLAEYVLRQGKEMIGIDNFSTGSKKIIEKLQNDHSEIEFLEGDVSDRSLMMDRRLSNVTEIYHLATPAATDFYEKNPFALLAANTIGVQNVLKLAYRNGAKVLYVSSGEAQSESVSINPVTRSDRNTHGHCSEDEAKRLGEIWCHEYWKRYGVDVKVVRLWNTYSSRFRNDDGRVIANFVKQSLSGEDITICGDGTQKRFFCREADVVRALILTMGNQNPSSEIIDIGSSEQYTITKIAELVKSLSRSNSRLTHQPLSEIEPAFYKPDMIKGKKPLGWEPELPLDEGLLKTIEAYKEHIGVLK